MILHITDQAKIVELDLKLKGNNEALPLLLFPPPHLLKNSDILPQIVTGHQYLKDESIFPTTQADSNEKHWVQHGGCKVR